MFKVGITGGIGTGKSTVCRIFSMLGIPVYDADSRAKWLTENDPQIRKELIAAFGPAVFDGSILNRAYLASAAFADESKTRVLNAITHPAVGRDFIEWAGQQSDAPYVIKEAALFYEADTAKEMNEMIVVTSPTSLRIERILHRDKHRSEKQIHDIMNRQLPDFKKIELADHVICNDEEQLLIPQILRLHEHFILQALL